MNTDNKSNADKKSVIPKRESIKMASDYHIVIRLQSEHFFVFAYKQEECLKCKYIFDDLPAQFIIYERLEDLYSYLEGEPNQTFFIEENEFCFRDFVGKKQKQFRLPLQKQIMTKQKSQKMQLKRLNHKYKNQKQQLEQQQLKIVNLQKQIDNIQKQQAILKNNLQNLNKEKHIYQSKQESQIVQDLKSINYLRQLQYIHEKTKKKLLQPENTSVVQDN